MKRWVLFLVLLFTLGLIGCRVGIVRHEEFFVVTASATTPALTLLPTGTPTSRDVVVATAVVKLDEAKVEMMRASFWPDLDSLERTSFYFGAEVEFYSRGDAVAGVTAFTLKAGEPVPDCQDWTIPSDRGLWHDEKKFTPGHHTFSQSFQYSDQPDYNQLIVRLRLWEPGVADKPLYCTQRAYYFLPTTPTPSLPSPTPTPILSPATPPPLPSPPTPTTRTG